MKTLSYNTEKEIKVGFMIIVIVAAVITILKIKELQFNDANSVETIRASRIEMNNRNSTSFPLADAKLIEEPGTVAQTPVGADVASGNEVAVQLKTWMNNKAYWNEEEVENEKALTQQMSTWLKNGTFFSDETFGESSTGKVEYQSDNAGEGYNMELNSQMKTWIAYGNYWSEASN